MSIKPKILVITGPTASGKTALSIEIARQFNGEIISADSRQIYRGMTIGTNKPTLAQLTTVPHHLIDIKDPDEGYSIANYQRDAIAAAHGIIARGKLPIMAGGTGLYIQAVVENLDIPKIKPDVRLRAQLEKEIIEKGLDVLYQKLIVLDPDAEEVIDPKNPRRVVRALEVAITTGGPFTALRRARDPLFETFIMGIKVSPEILRERINGRVDAMVKEGLAAEAEKLFEKYGRGGRLPVAFDTIGYRELIGYFRGALTLDQAIAAIKMDTWHYAKRQMTWFKKTAGLEWIADPTQASGLVSAFLNK